MADSKNGDEEKRRAQELYNEAAAALYLGIAARTLALWRSNGAYGLPFVRIGRSVRYSRAELDAFIAKHTVGAPMSIGVLFGRPRA